jgi:alpha-mannosidase
MVYDDAKKLYAEVRKDGEQLLEEAFEILFPSSLALSLSAPKKALDIPRDIVAFNTTPFPRREIVQVPVIGSLKTQLNSRSTDGTVAQSSADGSMSYVIMDCAADRNMAVVSSLSADITPASGW